MASSALIICTLQRPLELATALRAAGNAQTRPQFAVVVNADTGTATSAVVDAMSVELHWEIHDVPSKPGLASQRNLGICHALARCANLDYAHFIDDDVVVSATYFQLLEKALAQRPDAVLAGGRDIASKSLRPNLLGRVIGTHSTRQGALLSSAYNTGFSSTTGIHSVDWVSGCSQSFNLHVLGDCRFDEFIRFYGEEVDMHVRCSSYGSILYCPDAKFQHQFSRTGRDDTATVIEWSDCARWELCRRYPHRFSRARMLFATTMHLLTTLCLVISPKATSAMASVVGHSRFLRRLARGQSTADTPSWAKPT